MTESVIGRGKRQAKEAEARQRAAGSGVTLTNRCAMCGSGKVKRKGNGFKGLLFWPWSLGWKKNYKCRDCGAEWKI